MRMTKKIFRDPNQLLIMNCQLTNLLHMCDISKFTCSNFGVIDIVSNLFEKRTGFHTVNKNVKFSPILEVGPDGTFCYLNKMGVVFGGHVSTKSIMHSPITIHWKLELCSNIIDPSMLQIKLLPEKNNCLIVIGTKFNDKVLCLYLCPMSGVYVVVKSVIQCLDMVICRYGDIICYLQDSDTIITERLSVSPLGLGQRQQISIYNSMLKRQQKYSPHKETMMDLEDLEETVEDDLQPMKRMKLSHHNENNELIGYKSKSLIKLKNDIYCIQTWNDDSKIRLLKVGTGEVLMLQNEKENHLNHKPVKIVKRRRKNKVY